MIVFDMVEIDIAPTYYFGIHLFKLAFTLRIALVLVTR